MATPLDPTALGFLLAENRRMPMHVGGLQLFKKPEGAGRNYVREMYDEMRQVEDLAIGHARGSPGLDSQIFFQQRGAFLVDMQRRGALASAGVAPHERAPCLFVERIQTQQLLRMLDGLGKGPFVLEERNELSEHGASALAQALAVNVDPFRRAIGQQVALVETRRLLQRLAVSGQPPVGRCLEDDQVDHWTRV